MGDITIAFQTMGNPEKLINLCFEGMCFKHCLNIYSLSRRSLQNGGSVIEDGEFPWQGDRGPWLVLCRLWPPGLSLVFLQEVWEVEAPA